MFFFWGGGALSVFFIFVLAANTYYLFFRDDGDAKPDFVYFQVAPTALVQPWDLSHRVERQKLKVTRRREISVRVWKCGFTASLLLR